jgi:hypothetical protein
MCAAQCMGASVFQTGRTGANRTVSRQESVSWPRRARGSRLADGDEWPHNDHRTRVASTRPLRVMPEMAWVNNSEKPRCRAAEAHEFLEAHARHAPACYGVWRKAEGMKDRIPRCGAKTRQGIPCKAAAMWSPRSQRHTRCKNHGGMSTGPKTGRRDRARIRTAPAELPISDTNTE